MTPPTQDARKKRRVIVEEDEEGGVTKTMKQISNSLIPEIARRCSKQSKIENLKAISVTSASSEEVSLDEIKRLYGVDPLLMRAHHDALENESKFANPRNAYLHISETPVSPPAPASLPPPPADVTSHTSVNKKLRTEHFPASPSHLAEPQTPISSPTSTFLSSRPTWKEKNERLYENWKKATHGIAPRPPQFLSLEQRDISISVSYQQLPLDNSNDFISTTRPFQSFVSW
jgi:hypothetical protein